MKKQILINAGIAAALIGLTEGGKAAIRALRKRSSKKGGKK